MCKIKKIIISVLIAFVTVFSFNMTVGYTSYANEDELDVVYYTVDDSHIGNTSLEEFLDIEAAQNTGIISEDIEVDLNEQGIFDDEIEQFDENIIQLLNKGYDYDTYVTYYDVSDDRDIISEDNSMSERQIDELINEICNTEYESVSKNESVNIGESISRMLGLSLTAYASQDVEESSGGYVKQSLTIVNASKDKNGSKRVYVSYIVTWLKSPLYTATDVFGVVIKNATPVADTIRCKYTYTQYNESVSPDGTWISTEKRVQEDLLSRTKRNVYGVAADVNLATNRYIGNATVRFTNHVIKLSFYCTIDDTKNIKYVVPVGEYYHQKKAIGVSPSYSIVSGDISISPSVTSYMEEIRPNPSLIFYYK